MCFVILSYLYLGGRGEVGVCACGGGCVKAHARWQARECKGVRAWEGVRGACGRTVAGGRVDMDGRMSAF